MFVSPCFCYFHAIHFLINASTAGSHRLPRTLPPAPHTFSRRRLLFNPKLAKNDDAAARGQRGGAQGGHLPDRISTRGRKMLVQGNNEALRPSASNTPAAPVRRRRARRRTSRQACGSSIHKVRNPALKKPAAVYVMLESSLFSGDAAALRTHAGRQRSEPSIALPAAAASARAQRSTARRASALPP
jgi:hypothetical protein